MSDAKQDQQTQWRVLVFEHGPEAERKRDREFARVVDALDEARARVTTAEEMFGEVTAELARLRNTREVRAEKAEARVRELETALREIESELNEWMPVDDGSDNSLEKMLQTARAALSQPTQPGEK